MKNTISTSLIVAFSLLAFNTSYSANLEETLLVAQASSSLCKTYAEDMKESSAEYSEMSAYYFSLATKAGLTDDLKKYNLTVESLKQALDVQLINKYESKRRVYKEWCPRAYQGYILGITTRGS